MVASLVSSVVKQYRSFFLFTQKKPMSFQRRKLVAAQSGILMTLKPNCYSALTLQSYLLFHKFLLIHQLKNMPATRDSDIEFSFCKGLLSG